MSVADKLLGLSAASGSFSTTNHTPRRVS